MPALILHHPKHEAILKDPREQSVADPYPQTAETIAAAQVYQACERNKLGYIPPTEEEWARLEAVEAIGILIDKYGASRVASWVRNLSAIRGQEVS